MQHVKCRSRLIHLIRTSTELRAAKKCKHPRKLRCSGGVSAEPHSIMLECNGNKWGQRQNFPILCWDPARRLLPLPRSPADGSTSSVATHRLAPRAKEDRKLLPAPPNELVQSAIRKSRLVSEISSEKFHPRKDDNPKLLSLHRSERQSEAHAPSPHVTARSPSEKKASNSC